jgi:hypothetical protein
VRAGRGCPALLKCNDRLLGVFKAAALTEITNKGQTQEKTFDHR